MMLSLYSEKGERGGGGEKEKECIKRSWPIGRGSVCTCRPAKSAGASSILDVSPANIGQKFLLALL